MTKNEVFVVAPDIGEEERKRIMADIQAVALMIWRDCRVGRVDDERVLDVRGA